jgi:ribosomal protein S6--L-glutamate ligase
LNTFSGGPDKSSATPSGDAEYRRATPRRSDAPLHCGVLVESRYLSHAQPRGMVRALAAVGCRVTLIDPQVGLLDIENPGWFAGRDLIIACGRSTSLLARLSAAEAAGVPTLNQRSAIAAVLDKAHVTTQLRAAGIPVPATWIGAFEQVRRCIPDKAFPLVLKPVIADDGRGIRVVDKPAALQSVAWSDPCVIAQHLLPNNGFDIRLYAIDERVWAIRKPSALRGESGAVTPLPLPPAWRELALRCGDLFGLELFSVDCVEADGGLQVVEVHDFPNYTGVPEADLLLARHAARRATARRQA